MGVLGQSKDAGAAAVMPNVEGPVDRTGFFANVGAGFTQGVAGPHSTRNAQAIYETRYYDQIIKALKAEGEQGESVNTLLTARPTYKRDFRNPYSGSSVADETNPIAQFYLGGDTAEKAQIWAAVQRVRQRKKDFLKDFPDEGALQRLTDATRQRELATANDVTSRAGKLGTVGGFTGNMGGSLASGDPENAVGGIGGAAGKTVARTIIKRAVTGAVENTAAGMAALPGQAQDSSQHLGQEMTTGDMVRSVEETAGVGAGLSLVAGVAPHIIPKGKEVIQSVAGKALDVAGQVPVVRDALAAASIRAGTVQDRSLLSEYRRLHSPYGVVDTSSPDERAAAHVVERDATTKEVSPFHPDAAAHNDHRLDAVAQSLGINLAPEVPSPAPVQMATVRDRSGDAPRRPASFVDGINAAEGHTRNPRSSADGYGNFIDSTWLAIAPRVTDTAGMSKAEILNLRHDKDIAGRATALYGQDNGRYLRSHGQEDSPGNLSLAHFLGPEGARELLAAHPETPVESILPPAVIHANREVLAGKSASQVIAWAHKRIGASVEGPVARADAVPEADMLDAADYSDVPYERATFKPDELQTDAALMQYKGGGDENGVTNKLKDVTAWDPLMSSEVLVWEGNDGRRIVVDGHQRTGLAKRLNDPSIELPALVVKESDGISAAQARTLGAMRNINLGTGSLLDNARVLRDAPQGADMIKGATDRREIEGLAKLNYEAFGAVINDVIDPRIAAEIGKHSPPEAHMAMVDLLRKERIRNPQEAANIVRQATADGFGSASEHQLGMFGDTPQQALYVPIARILDASAKRLRDEKRTFKVLATKSGKIEAAGNILDKTANEGKVIGSDEALAILNATAHRSGPVRDALIAAARAELSGARRGDAVNGFLDALAGIDLRTAAAGLESHGGLGEPSGETGGRDAAASSDEVLAGSHGPSLYDHAVAARDAAEPFSDPVGEGAKSQADLLEHDLKMDAGLTFDQSLAKAEAKAANVHIDAHERNGTVYLNAVERMDGSEPGAGAAAIRGVLREADRLDMPVTLRAHAMGNARPQEKLMDYYRQFGFQEVGPNTSEMLRPEGGETDPNIAARQTQETALKAASPLQSIAEQQGTMGLGLFDVADQPTFRLSDEGDAKPLADILAESEADTLAAQALRECLK